MTISVGTFNLNNLFSRFNFQGAIRQLQQTDSAMGALTIRYEFTDPSTFRVRTFRGSLVRAKDADDTADIARRIREIDVDVLAVQEVENIDILRGFNRDELGGLYSYQVLLEGNDPRFIDVGLLSKLPIGAVTSHQTAEHPEVPGERVFGRDLMEVEIRRPNGNKLFTLYNNHLKSHFVPFNEDQTQGALDANERRRRQAETISRIVAARQRPDSRFVILGDLNDPEDTPALAGVRTVEDQNLTNALQNPVETRPPKDETSGPNPTTTAWTYRHKESGQPAEHLLYDQIWLSPALAPKQTAAFVDRRTKHGGDGSDHDPAWIVLDL